MLEEKIFHSDSNIKYIFKEGNKSVKKLIVIFSGYAANDSNLKHRYNYLNILENTNIHKLFILDNNGETGSYYFGENLNFNVDSSVISLILFKAREYNVNLEDIISLGSSKGGSAALYFGIKYKFGAVFSGAFQTKIADLITLRRPESEKFLLGNLEDKDYAKRYNQLNSIMFNLLESPVLSNLYLISSPNDWQYDIHVKPFIEKLKQLNIAHDFYLSKEMQNHSEISIYFPKYFKSKLINELFNIHIEKLDLNLRNNTFVLQEKSLNLSRNQFKLEYNYRVNTESYLIETNKEYTPSIPGYYKFYLTIKDFNNEVIYQKLLDDKYYDAGILPEPVIKTEILDDKLICEIVTKTKENLTFAYYIKENGKIIDKIMYQDENTISINIVEGNKYSIQCFIRYKNSFKVVKSTNPILV